MRWRTLLLLVIFAGSIALAKADDPKPTRPWLGVHVSANHGTDLEKLSQSVPALGKLGINSLIVEVNYGFAFQSHPELFGLVQSRRSRLEPSVICAEPMAFGLSRL